MPPPHLSAANPNRHLLKELTKQRAKATGSSLNEPGNKVSIRWNYSPTSRRWQPSQPVRSELERIPRSVGKRKVQPKSETLPSTKEAREARELALNREFVARRSKRTETQKRWKKVDGKWEPTEAVQRELKGTAPRRVRTSPPLPDNPRADLKHSLAVTGGRPSRAYVHERLLRAKSRETYHTHPEWKNLSILFPLKDGDKYKRAHRSAQREAEKVMQAEGASQELMAQTHASNALRKRGITGNKPLTQSQEAELLALISQSSPSFQWKRLRHAGARMLEGEDLKAMVLLAKRLKAPRDEIAHLQAKVDMAYLRKDSLPYLDPADKSSPVRAMYYAIRLEAHGASPLTVLKAKADAWCQANCLKDADSLRAHMRGWKVVDPESQEKTIQELIRFKNIVRTFAGHSTTRNKAMRSALIRQGVPRTYVTKLLAGRKADGLRGTSDYLRAARAEVRALTKHGGASTDIHRASGDVGFESVFSQYEHRPERLRHHPDGRYKKAVQRRVQEMKKAEAPENRLNRASEHAAKYTPDENVRRAGYRFRREYLAKRLDELKPKAPEEVISPAEQKVRHAHAQAMKEIPQAKKPNPFTVAVRDIAFQRQQRRNN